MKVLVVSVVSLALIFSSQITLADNEQNVADRPKTVTVHITDYASDLALNDANFGNVYGTGLLITTGSALAVTLAGSVYFARRGIWKGVRACAAIYQNLLGSSGKGLAAVRRDEATAPASHDEMANSSFVRRNWGKIAFLGSVMSAFTWGFGGAQIPVGSTDHTFVLNNATEINLPQDTSFIHSLDFSFSVQCDQDIPTDQVRGVRGYVLYQGRVTLIDFFEGQTARSVILGTSSRADDKPLFVTDQNPHCKLQIRDMYVTSTSTQLDPKTVWNDPKQLNALKRMYAPFVGIRPDQARNPSTDLVLDNSPTVIPNPERHTTTLVYTVYWSDEDSLNKQGIAKSMGRYARATDIEKSYSIELRNDTLEPVDKGWFQGGQFHGIGIGHGFYLFDGSFLPGTKQPVIYDIANHNVFNDKSRNFSSVVGYSYEPGDFVPYPEAREHTMFSNPWQLAVSSDEHRREGKLPRDPQDYLYVRLRATGPARLGSFLSIGISEDSVVGKVELKDRAGVVRTFRAEGSLDRFGEDLHQRESYIAIPMGQSFNEAKATLDGIMDGRMSGVFDFDKYGRPEFELDPSAVRFYRFVRNGAHSKFVEIAPVVRLISPTRGSEARFSFQKR